MWDDVWVKRDDLTSPLYGGNKVRTLEVLFGRALDDGYKSVVATGAYGSNHAVATALHATRIGLSSGILLFPQPWSECAAENLRVSASLADDARSLPHWLFFPLAFARARRKRQAYVMPPGGASPLGALGYVSAALELAGQIERGELPAPRTIIIAVGSTCTSAGLLAGFHVAARLGIGFQSVPTLMSVRVTPWPVTSSRRITSLAARCLRLLSILAADPKLPTTPSALRRGLEVVPGYLGGGYGVPTAAGRAAMARFAEPGAPRLDTTYSAKSAAALLDHIAKPGPGPTLYWATKSSAPLPEVTHFEAMPAPMRRWLGLTERHSESSPPA